MTVHAKLGADVGRIGPLRMADLFLRHDWASTPLGRREAWPVVLRTTVDLMLASLHPMCVMWGPSRIFLYNDGYADILGARHPSALGLPGEDVWPELWDEIAPLVDRTFGGESFAFRDQPLTMTRNGFEEQVWYDFAYSPVRDERGAVVGLLNVTSDCTARVVSQRERDAAIERLRAGEERLAALVEASSDSLYSMSPDWQEMRTLQGRGFIADTDAPSVRWMDEYLFPEDQGEVRAEIAAAVGKSEPFQLEHRVRLADGGAGWIFSRAVPVRDKEGGVTEWFGMAADVTERHRAVEQLRESESFMRGVLAASNDCIKVLDLDAKLAFMSEGGKRVMEVSDFNAIAGCPWPNFWEGEGNLAAKEAIAAAQAGVASGFQGYADTMKGNRRYWDVQVSPILGCDGRPERILSISRDVTDLKAAEEARAVLTQELAHRMKNSLAMVQAIVTQTLRQAKTMEEGRAAVGQRLSALGRAQDILTRSNFTEADIHDVVSAAIEPHRVAEQRITWSGPHLILTSQQALGLSLATHELATNAAKYGALSNETGRVAMSWRVEDGTFAFDWVETGGPPVTPPAGRGFGSKLIERIVASYFEGEGCLDFDPAGIRFRLTGVPGGGVVEA
ncbi:PAS domain S-box-containing protein [Methylobacterium sp. UNC300MFChir4.1]|uniref:PAS domain-containing sensor histidine kinase n=1 Tax=Methylobacterium sp. UNC300MFChir4.1 TaxID=1502747 RepID=UPI0008BAA613|nr:PAS domain-containing sensor histidine kinase [Methylobacterium sp. UNC300MFChir4.1]SEP25501.1 PAS domain S-box-containing protein [Methylobacterium sp. UNC300MFChir4.1]